MVFAQHGHHDIHGLDHQYQNRFLLKLGHHHPFPWSTNNLNHNQRHHLSKMHNPNLGMVRSRYNRGQLWTQGQAHQQLQSHY